MIPLRWHPVHLHVHVHHVVVVREYPSYWGGYFPIHGWDWAWWALFIVICFILGVITRLSS